jgi:hypothetical protein
VHEIHSIVPSLFLFVPQLQDPMAQLELQQPMAQLEFAQQKSPTQKK